MKIYIVERNADTTEGRGPMVIDSVWLDWNKAAAYIDDKPGVMGRRAKWSESPDDWRIVTMETRGN